MTYPSDETVLGIQNEASALASSREREKVLFAGPLARLVDSAASGRVGLQRAPCLRIASMNITHTANGKCEKGRILRRSMPAKDGNLPAIDTTGARTLCRRWQVKKHHPLAKLPTFGILIWRNARRSRLDLIGPIQPEIQT